MGTTLRVLHFNIPRVVKIKAHVGIKNLKKALAAKAQKPNVRTRTSPYKRVLTCNQSEILKLGLLCKG
jgi:hypothetical protein